MRVHAEQVHRQDAHVDLERADGLDRVAVEGDPGLAAERADRPDRLQRPDLVVAVHDRHDRGAIVDRGAHRIRGHPTVPIDREHRDACLAVGLEVVGRVEDGVVLDRRGDDAVGLALAGLQHAAEREVVGSVPPEVKTISAGPPPTAKATLPGPGRRGRACGPPRARRVPGPRGGPAGPAPGARRAPRGRGGAAGTKAPRRETKL